MTEAELGIAAQKVAKRFPHRHVYVGVVLDHKGELEWRIFIGAKAGEQNVSVSGSSLDQVLDAAINL